MRVQLPFERALRRERQVHAHAAAELVRPRVHERTRCTTRGPPLRRPPRGPVCLVSAAPHQPRTSSRHEPHARPPRASLSGVLQQLGAISSLDHRVQYYCYTVLATVLPSYKVLTYEYNV